MGYRRRRYGSRSSYGSERAKWHVAQARAFSDEVGHADAAVKEAFFRLSGKALDYLLDKYGELCQEVNSRLRECCTRSCLLSAVRWRCG